MVRRKAGLCPSPSRSVVEDAHSAARAQRCARWLPRKGSHQASWLPRNADHPRFVDARLTCNCLRPRWRVSHAAP
eukprot:7180958-Prymnesium_polylepis.1